MKLEIKKRWLEALRSGEYEQGKDVLRRNDSFCCLGVLCDIFAKEGCSKWDEPDDKGVRHIENDKGALPLCVVLWSGIKDGNPFIDGYSLSAWNDGGKSFKEIADIIEKEL